MQDVRSRFSELRPPYHDLGAAAAEAERCLDCGGVYAPAPCVVACPASVDVPGFIRAIAEGDPGRASEIVFADNPVGASCSRVCPTPVLCEGACVLNHEGDTPVAIARLQRFATDFGLAHRSGSAQAPEISRKGRVCIIGAGPGGLAAASELRRMGFEVVVYDGRPAVGGLVRYAIAPYRLWSGPLDEEAERLRDIGVVFRLGTPVDSPERLATIDREFDAVYLAIGLGEDMELEIPGHELEGVYAALPWIEMLKEGQRPPLGERVAVIGGGNTAIDVAREAVRLGAHDVTMLYRRTEAEMPAYHFEVEEGNEEGVRVLWLTIPIEFVGSGRLEGVKCRYARLSDPDESGRRRPVEIPGTEFIFPCDTAITALGQVARGEFLGWIPGLSPKGGSLAVDGETGQTANPKYFAGGDAVNGGATAVQAVGDAKRAARGIARYLEAKLS